MSHLSSHYVITVERNLRRISFVDTESLTVLHQLDIGFDVIDVDITYDKTKAVVSAFYDKKLIEIDLTSEPPVIQSIVPYNTYLEDVSTAPNNKFAVSVDGSSGLQDMVSLNLINQSTSSIPADAQAVAVSPNGNNYILTARYFYDRARLYLLNNDGTITDTSKESLFHTTPINITYSPFGNFAFAATDSRQEVIVLDTSNPNYYGEASRIKLDIAPQTIVVSKNGKRVYVLTYSDVKIMDFDPVAKKLTIVNSFIHGSYINGYYGVDQMALDDSESRLFISGSNGFKAFTVDGALVGTAANVFSDGGVASTKSYVFPINTMLVADTSKQLHFINVDSLEVFGVIELPYLANGIAATSDHKKILMTSSSYRKLMEVSVEGRYPIVTSVVDTISEQGAIAITPDNKFSVSKGGDNANNSDLLSYSLSTKSMKYISGNIQTMALSSAGNGRIITGGFDTDKILIYFIDGNGNLINNDNSFTAAGNFISFDFITDSTGAFGADVARNELVVIYLGNILNNMFVVERIPLDSAPQTVLLSSNGEILYVLDQTKVNIYKYQNYLSLTYMGSFEHNATIKYLNGINQMALDTTNTRLFILSENNVLVYTTEGQFLKSFNIVPTGAITAL